MKIVLDVKLYIQKMEKELFKKSEFLNSKFDYEKLNSRICGITCIKMCIEYFKNINIPLVQLTEEMIKMDGLSENGSIHFKLIELARKYGLEGMLLNESREDRLKTALNFMLSNNHLLIASVRPCLFDTNITERKNGHLVLIKGIDEKFIYLNDPSYSDDRYKKNKKIKYANFLENFSGNFICISNMKNG